MCNQPWDESSREKVTRAYLCISVSGGPEIENRASHLRHPEPRLCTFPPPHSRRLCLQPVLPDLGRCGRAGPGVTCICKQIRHSLCSRKGQREKSAFWPGFGSYPAALFHFHWVWLAPGKDIQRNTWEILWHTSSHSCASLGGKKNARGFPFSSRLSQHFVFLFGNKWNWGVSRCFATIPQSSPTSDPSRAYKRAALRVQPAPLDFPRRSPPP